MAVQITPSIATAAQAYAYLGISSTAAAANITSGVTLAAWIADLLDRTAQMIVAEINQDFTPGQIFWLRDFGNDLEYINVPWPVQSITAFTSWDPNNPTEAPINIGAGVLSVPANYPYTIVYNGGYFSRFLQYYIEITQAISQKYNGWPFAIQEIQCEMIQTIYNESTNGFAMLTVEERESVIGRPIKLDKEVWERIKLALRPFKIYPQ